MTEPILHATGLRRVFGAHTAVHDVTLSIHAGQRHALIGPNGAGKTTLLNLLAGTLHPTAGSITWLGHDITRRGPVYRAQAGIGRSFQTPTALPSLSTVDNLILAAWPHPPHTPRWPPARRRHLYTAALEQLDALGLADQATTPAGALGHGQRRLLDIAMALAGKPRLLLLDEPAAGLDDTDIGRLLRLLAALPASTAVLLVEHHLDLVATVADTVTLLHHGRVAITGSHQQVITNPVAHAIYPGLEQAGGPDAAR